MAHFPKLYIYATTTKPLASHLTRGPRGKYSGMVLAFDTHLDHPKYGSRQTNPDQR